MNAFLSGPVAMLNADAPAELRRIFPHGVPVRHPLPGVVEIEKSTVASFEMLAFELEWERCRVEQLVKVAEFVCAHLGGDPTEAYDSILERGIPIRARLVAGVFNNIPIGGGSHEH